MVVLKGRYCVDYQVRTWLGWRLRRASTEKNLKWKYLDDGCCIKTLAYYLMFGTFSEIKNVIAVYQMEYAEFVIYLCSSGSVSIYCTDGSSDRSLIVDPLSYFVFQPLINICIRGHGMCYHACGNDEYKRTLAANKKNLALKWWQRFHLWVILYRRFDAK